MYFLFPIDATSVKQALETPKPSTGDVAAADNAEDFDDDEDMDAADDDAGAGLGMDQDNNDLLKDVDTRLKYQAEDRVGSSVQHCFLCCYV